MKQKKLLYETAECRTIQLSTTEKWCQSGQTPVSGLNREALENDDWYEF